MRQNQRKPLVKNFTKDVQTGLYTSQTQMVAREVVIGFANPNGIEGGLRNIDEQALAIPPKTAHIRQKRLIDR
jgi:hypothetical protein